MRESPPRVITIPAKPESIKTQETQRQLRVAAYCRVSTDDEEQLTSYEAQQNYYTDKIMDIGAKRIAPDKDGVRIAELDEEAYRRELWTHRPLTDFWRVGKGYSKKLEANGIFTMAMIGTEPASALSSPRIRLVASSPSITGIRTSIRIAS